MFLSDCKPPVSPGLQGVLLGSVLFPLRTALASLFFLIMWPLARLRLAGLSPEQRSRPVTGWRRWLLHPVIWLLSRAVFTSLGFFWVKVKGQRADLKEAPVLVVAPHSGFMDMLVLCPAQLATVVSRSENSSLPVIGGERRHEGGDGQTGRLFVFSLINEGVVGSRSSLAVRGLNYELNVFAVILMT